MDQQLVKILPEIIKQAAVNPFGLLALMIIGLSILAYFFFRGAAEKVRVVIFVMLFFGVVLFGAVAMKKASTVNDQKVSPAPQPTVPAPQPQPIGLKLVASIWRVELDHKTILATKEFSSERGRGLPPKALKEFAEWVSNELKLTARGQPVRVGVEKFAGSEPDKLTERVCNELKANRLMQIVDHVMLETSPRQGIDYIISGSAQPKTP